jgi:hypothetical protein
VGERVFVDGLLAQPEVGQLDVTFGIQQNVLRLQVSVDNALTVQVLQRQCDLGDIETSLKMK